MTGDKSEEEGRGRGRGKIRTREGGRVTSSTKNNVIFSVPTTCTVDQAGHNGMCS